MIQKPKRRIEVDVRIKEQEVYENGLIGATTFSIDIRANGFEDAVAQIARAQRLWGNSQHDCDADGSLQDRASTKA